MLHVLLLPHFVLNIKGIVHPKMKILSSFTHPQVVPNLYECLYSAEHKGRYSELFWYSEIFSIFFPTMEVNGAPKQPGYKLSSKYLPLCSAEQRHSYRFGTTWGWVNDDRIFIFGWTSPLSNNLKCKTFYHSLPEQPLVLNTLLMQKKYLPYKCEVERLQEKLATCNFWVNYHFKSICVHKLAS